MSDMDSLEDMLAALESPSSAGGNRGGNRGGAPQGRGGATAVRKSVPAPADDDIDAFLNEIDQESRGSTSYGGNNRASAQPAGRGAQGGAQGGRGGMAASGGRGGGANRPPPQQSRASVSPSQGGGGDDLESQGYEVHNNKGKWFSPPKTNKASDFRINGTTSTRVGMVHAITLKALDDYGNPAKIESPKEFIGISLTHQESGQAVQPWFRDNGDCTYNCAFFAELSGTTRMEIKLCGNPMFDLSIQVEDIGDSVWVAKPRLPAKPKELFVIDIVTVDGSTPEGVAPFEVQTMGDVEQLRLINNGNGSYKFQCVPQAPGHVTVQLSLHGQPIRDSPVTVKVGDGLNPMKVKQESGPVETISDTRNRNMGGGNQMGNRTSLMPVNAGGHNRSSQVPMNAGNRSSQVPMNAGNRSSQVPMGGGSKFYNAEPIDDYNDPPPGGYDYGDDYGDQDVSNDDLAALLDELGS